MTSFDGLHIHFLYANPRLIPEHDSADVKDWTKQVSGLFHDATSDHTRDFKDLDKLAERRPAGTKWVLLWPAHYFMPLELRGHIASVLSDEQDMTDVYTVQTRAAPDLGVLNCDQTINPEQKLPVLKPFTRAKTLQAEVTENMLVTRQHLLVRPISLEKLEVEAFTVSSFILMPKSGVDAAYLKVKLLTGLYAVPRRTFIGPASYPKGGALHFVESWDRQSYIDVIRYGQHVMSPGSDLRKRLASELTETKTDWFTSQEDLDDVVFHLFCRALVMPVEGQGPVASESPIVRLFQHDKRRKEHVAWLIKNVYGPENYMSRILVGIYASSAGQEEDQNTQYVQPLTPNLASLLPKVVTPVVSTEPEKPKCSLGQKIRIAISLALTLGVNLYRFATVCPANTTPAPSALKDEL